MKNYKVLPSFEGVSAGQTATLRFPIGDVYETAFLSYSGVTLAQITGIRVKANGSVIQSFKSGVELDSFNKFQGRAAAAGVIAIDFIRYGLLTRLAREKTALATGTPNVAGGPGISTLALEVDIAGAASAPVLSCSAHVAELPRELEFIRHVRSNTYNAPSTGIFEISDWSKGHLFNQVHFFNGDIDGLEVERNRFSLFDRSDAENRLIQNDGVRVPQTNIFTFDPTEDGYGAETLQTAGVHDLRFKLDMSGTGSIPVLIDSIGPL